MFDLCYMNHKPIKNLVYPEKFNFVSITIFEKTKKNPINNFFP